MPKSSKPPVDAPTYAPQFGGELRGYSDMPNSGEIPAEQVRTLIHGYYAATSYMDAQVGKVLDTMDSLKLWEQRLYCFGAIMDGISEIMACGANTLTTNKPLDSVFDRCSIGGRRHSYEIAHRNGRYLSNSLRTSWATCSKGA